ncbi:MAG: pantetheine-phosphate adenylyltransferase [candidate division Zixibacteria bacterium]|nr:pantetheine-phosphate adenylyltransferase [candidate division Zixibacteria bacterium]
MRATRGKNTKRLAIYPGSFDPITNGHLSLIQRAGAIFDNVTVVIADNSDKRTLFSFEERLKMAKQVFRKYSWVNVDGLVGLTAKYAQKNKAVAILRGIRAVSDFEFEFQLALMNRKIARNVETVFLMPSLSWVYLSSTLVKDIARYQGDVSTLVPSIVNRALIKKYAELRKS